MITTIPMDFPQIPFISPGCPCPSCYRKPCLSWHLTHVNKTIKNQERSEILLYLQTNNSLMIMDVDIRHETPGPETMNFITATAVARALALSCTDSLSLKSRWVAWGGSAVSFRWSGLGYKRGTSVYYYRCREGLKEAALEQNCGMDEFE